MLWTLDVMSCVSSFLVPVSAVRSLRSKYTFPRQGVVVAESGAVPRYIVALQINCRDGREVFVVA